MKLNKKFGIALMFALAIICTISFAGAKAELSIVKVDAETQGGTEGGGRQIAIELDEPATSAILEYAIDGETYSVSHKSIEGSTVLFQIDSSLPGKYDLSTIHAKAGGHESALEIKDISFTITPSQEYINDTDAIQPIERTNSRLRTSASNKKVVVLDAGHCGSHTGAYRDGLREEVIALKIAQSAYNELKKNPNIEVYMTRNSNSCPAGGGSTSNCLTYRSNFSKNRKADLFVSFHINSTTHASQTSATGALVYISAYSKYNKTSTILTENILSELKNRVGLKNGGTRLNNDDHANGKYDDGVWKDDLAVIRNNVLAGIEPVLVEHAFINNPNDRAVLRDDSKVKAMGVANAAGISKYLGLSANSWNINGMNIEPNRMAASIKANASGDTSGFQYKFVYNKLNEASGSYDWKVWDVIKDFSTNSAVNWTAPVSGKYEICMDVKDKNGKIYNYTSKVALESWDIKGVSATESGNKFTIKPNASGAATGFKYKFVYNKYNESKGSYDWVTWDVIKDMSTDNAKGVTWAPPSSGKYEIYMDVQDNNGKLYSYKTAVTTTGNIVAPTPAGPLSGVNVSLSKGSVGDVVTISPKISGTAGVKYKYVYSYNNWAPWGVASGPTTNTSASHKLEKSGKCELIIDAIYDNGTVISKSTTISVEDGNLVFSGVKVPATGKVGEKIRIDPIATGMGGSTFKYVYAYNNWAPWGVLKDFTSDQAASIKLSRTGYCDIYIDAKDKNGKVTTHSARIKVTK